MGVNRLWDVLSPTKTTHELSYVKGKSVAIDISIWLCAARQISHSTLFTSTSFYLRNIFFRTRKLLLLEVLPVYVLEGMAPDVKHLTMVRRMGKQSNECNRLKFSTLISTCEQLSKCLGVPCVRAFGEAEEMCAFLNSKQLVDGCITNDADAFLYGATTLFKIVSISQDKVECYSMDDIKKSLNLDREKLIAFALLHGCDYVPGVPGVGKSIALKCLNGIADGNALQRMKEWVTAESKSNECFSKMASVQHQRHCSRCKHEGVYKIHFIEGCQFCSSTKGCLQNNINNCRCSWHVLQDAVKEEEHNEFNVWKKAITVSDFPSQKVITEFMSNKNLLPEKCIQWDKPDITSFLIFASEYLYWSYKTSFSKIFPIWTLWCLCQIKRKEPLTNPPVPKRILGVKKKQGQAVVEVEWDTNSVNNEIDSSVGFHVPCPLISLETFEIFQNAFPEFLETNAMPLKRKASKRKVLEISGCSESSVERDDSTSIKSSSQTIVKRQKMHWKSSPSDTQNNGVHSYNLRSRNK